MVPDHSHHMGRIMRKPVFWFLTRSDTYYIPACTDSQPQKTARGLEFQFQREEEFFYVAKSKELISSPAILVRNSLGSNLFLSFIFTVVLKTEINNMLILQVDIQANVQLSHIKPTVMR